MKYLYKYPAAGVSRIGTWSRRTGGGRARSSSTSCSTRACSTRTATSTCSWSTRRPARRTCSSAITVHNRGPEAARLRVLPTLWFRNTWSWGEDEPKPVAARGRAGRDPGRRTPSWASTGCRATATPELLFTENESNAERLWGQPERRRRTSRTRSTRTSSRASATR